MAAPLGQRSVGKLLLIVAKAAIGIGILAFIFRQIGWDSVARLLRSTDLLQFALACTLLAAGLAAQALRWSTVMASLAVPLGARAALVGTFESMFLSQILPSSVGGDALRALRAYDEGARPGEAILGVLVDRAFGLWFISGVVLLAWLAGGSTIIWSTPFRILAAIAGVLFLGAIAAAALGLWSHGRSLPKWLSPLVALLQTFTRVVGNLQSMLQLVVVMTVSTLLLALALQRCGVALGLPIGLVDALIVLQGMMLASVIPLSIGGWGWREGAAVLLLGAAGVGSAEATGLSILYGLTLTVMGLVGASIWVLAGYKRFERQDGLSALRSFKLGSGRKDETR